MQARDLILEIIEQQHPTMFKGIHVFGRVPISQCDKFVVEQDSSTDRFLCHVFKQQVRLCVGVGTEDPEWHLINDICEEANKRLDVYRLVFI